MKSIRLNPFSVSSVKSAQEELKAYKATLKEKCQTFVERLADAGMEVGQQNTGAFSQYIMFEKKTEMSAAGCKAIMIAQSDLIEREWYISSTATKTANISPILFAEFGAGLKADNPKAGEFGMGTGTFPGQTHAEDPHGWYYKSVGDNQWHHSSGISPTMPMFKAANAMREKVRSIAREVFSS